MSQGKLFISILISGCTWKFLYALIQGHNILLCLFLPRMLFITRFCCNKKSLPSEATAIMSSYENRGFFSLSISRLLKTYSRVLFCRNTRLFVTRWSPYCSSFQNGQWAKTKHPLPIMQQGWFCSGVARCILVVLSCLPLEHKGNTTVPFLCSLWLCSTRFKDDCWTVFPALKYSSNNAEQR